MVTERRRIVVLALLLLVLGIGLLLGTAAAQADGDSVSVTIDGEPLWMDVPGSIQEGRTLVPFRPIFEGLGAEVTWDPDSQTVTAERGEETLVLTIGSRVVEWRGSLIKVDAPPVIVNGRTLVPLRLVAQALGLYAQWDAPSRRVDLQTRPSDPVLASGIRIVHDKGCMVCHTINGAGGQVGPNLNGVTERYSQEWLRTWLHNPQGVRKGSRMPNFHFSDTEIDSVIIFLDTLQ